MSIQNINPIVAQSALHIRNNLVLPFLYAHINIYEYEDVSATIYFIVFTDNCIYNRWS